MSEAWGGARRHLQKKRTLREMFDLPLEALEHADKALVEELETDGWEVALARAQAEGDDLQPDPVHLLDSPHVVTYLMPLVVEALRLRRLLAAERIEEAKELVDEYFLTLDPDRLDLIAETYRILGLGEPRAQGWHSLDEPSVETTWTTFRSESHPERMLAVDEFHRAQEAKEYNDPLRCLPDLEFWTRQLCAAAVVYDRSAFHGVGFRSCWREQPPWNVPDPDESALWMEAWALPQIAAEFRKAAKLDVRVLVDEEFDVSAALDISGDLLTERGPAAVLEFAGALDRHLKSGTPESGEFPAAPERRPNRKTALGAIRAEALAEAGRLDEAARELADHRFFAASDEVGIAMRWARLTGYLQGRNEASSNPQTMEILKSIAAMLRITNRTVFGISERIESLPTAIGNSIDQALRERNWDSLRDALLTDLRRANAETAASALLGNSTWVALDEESRKDLVGVQLLKQWNLPDLITLQALGLTRAVERELGKTLAFAGYDRGDRMELGPMTGLCQSQPEGSPLRRLAEVADEAALITVRNKAAHTRRVTDAEFRAVEEASFRPETGILALTLAAREQRPNSS